MSSKTARTFAAAGPVVLVNAVAFSGQLAFLRVHLPWSLPGQVLVAVALESVAIYLAFHAHVAQLANDSALRLRLAAYGFALVIGAMNYSHYAAPHWRPTFPAVAVALMSASSPWLWGVHSRRASRDQLLATGQIEGHALRLGSTRWLWHPIRSARVMWHATWEGITDPASAIAAAFPVVAEIVDELPDVPADDELAAMTKAEAGRLALAHNDGNVILAQQWLQARGVPIDRSYLHEVKSGRGGRRRRARRQPLALVAGGDSRR